VGPEVTMGRLDPAFERLALGRSSGPVEIRSVSSGTLLATLPASSSLPTFDGRWSPDGRFLAVKRDRSADGGRTDLEVWDVAGARRVLLAQDTSYGASAFHPRLPLLLAGLRNGMAAVWDLE